MSKARRIKEKRATEEKEKREKIKKERKFYLKSVSLGIGGFFLLIGLIVGIIYSYNYFTSPKSQDTSPERKTYSQVPAMQIDTSKKYFATLETSLGNIKIELFAKDAPKTVNNFVFLSREKFYDGLTFHRVIRDFMIQGGDPKGDGTGDPGYKFEDENPPQREYKRGIVAMANSGKNSNGSQFFIMHKDKPDLPPNYTIFGKVIEGIETVDKIAETEVEPNASGENSIPKTKMEIKKITIEET